jgi:hypothetical protein
MEMYELEYDLLKKLMTERSVEKLFRLFWHNGRP